MQAAKFPAVLLCNISGQDKNIARKSGRCAANNGPVKNIFQWMHVQCKRTLTCIQKRHVWHAYRHDALTLYHTVHAKPWVAVCKRVLQTWRRSHT